MILFCNVSRHRELNVRADALSKSDSDVYVYNGQLSFNCDCGNVCLCVFFDGSYEPHSSSMRAGVCVCVCVCVCVRFPPDKNLRSFSRSPVDSRAEATVVPTQRCLQPELLLNP